MEIIKSSENPIVIYLGENKDIEILSENSNYPLMKLETIITNFTGKFDYCELIKELNNCTGKELYVKINNIEFKFVFKDFVSNNSFFIICTNLILFISNIYSKRKVVSILQSILLICTFLYLAINEKEFKNYVKLSLLINMSDLETTLTNLEKEKSKLSAESESFYQTINKFFNNNNISYSYVDNMIKMINILLTNIKKKNPNVGLQIEQKILVGLKEAYLLYMEKYGIPEDGVFDEVKLKEFS